MQLSLIFALVLGNLLGLFFFARVWSQRQKPWPNSVGVLVLGDLGRSPRMLAHVASLAGAGFDVFVFAYAGTSLPETFHKNERISLFSLPTPLANVSTLPLPLFLFLTPVRIIISFFSILYVLVMHPTFLWPLEYLIVQNPPAIPTLFLTSLLSSYRGTKVILDWHNTGYSVLALRLGSNHPVVRLAKFIELRCARHAYSHLCVSEAMKTQVEDVYGLAPATVFYDRPSKALKRLDPEEAHEFLVRHPDLFSGASSKETLLTKKSSRKTPAVWKGAHDKLLVSSTSWTADEDFGLLLRALDLYDAAAQENRLPKVIIVVTGKGHLRSDFEQRVAKRNWSHVRAKTAWLSLDDYARLLGVADLGISLHTSSSGIDLPMKVVDMLGAKLAVAAYDFPCLGELVHEGENGETFTTAEELAGLLLTLLPGNQYDSLRKGIRDDGAGLTWDEHWTKRVLPLIKKP